MAGPRCPSSDIRSQVAPRSRTSKIGTGSKSSSFSCLPEQRLERGDVLVEACTDFDREVRVRQVRIGPRLGQSTPRVASQERTTDRFRPEGLWPAVFAAQQRVEAARVVLRRRVLAVEPELEGEDGRLADIACPDHLSFV